MRLALRLFILLSAFVPALAAAPDKEALKREVAAMEDQFCTMAREHGLRTAFQPPGRFR